MNTQSCYAGEKAGTHNPPVVPSLLTGAMLRGSRTIQTVADDGDETVVPGVSTWHKGSCGGPCASGELIKRVFGDED